ncbi:MAG: AI-2E family transporter [Deferribacteraceae bacterium]|jgi:predicted PurR-regulated permease PerM|nr:AI-2E family transporter [Deferribacteraceae bacterium]
MELRFSIKNLLTIAAVILLFYIILSAGQVIVITLFGFLFAYMLSPFATRLSRKMPYPLAALIVLGFTLLIFAALFIWLLPKIYTDLTRVAHKMPVYVTFIIDKATEISKLLNIDMSSTEVYNAAAAKLADSGATIARWLANLLGSVQSAVSITFSLAMVPVIAGFVLVDYPQIQAFLDKYTGNNHEKGLRRYISLSSEVLAAYFRGQFAVMAILCVLYIIVLKIIGLESAILLGAITGMLSIVPYLGFSVGVVLSVLFAAVQFQDLFHPMYVVIGYAAVQLLESFIITPKIVGDSVGLRPIATMIVLLINGAVFGIVGMIFALPIAAIIFRLYKDRLSDVAKQG